MADVCSGFEPQNYLKDRCRKCFRQKDKHIEAIVIPQIKKERRKSWKERNGDNGAPEEASLEGIVVKSVNDIALETNQKSPGSTYDENDVLSVSSYRSATSKGLSSAKSMESVNDTKSMVTAVSGSIEEEERAMTPTEYDTSMVMSIKEELARLREANKQLKEERETWTMRKSVLPKDGTDQSLIQMLEERIGEAESSIQDYRDENTVLKCELRELQEATYANSDVQLKEKIKTTEACCDELMEENEALKAEVKDLQHEIEEMQDQYREEEIEEFRELQRELEQNAKNCRVLQFKLRKAERMREQTETEKGHMQQKLTDLLAGSSDGVAISLRSDSARVKELESELRIAKEVSVRLHNELEQTEEKRYKLEDEVFYQKEKIRELQTQNKWREARNKTDNAVKRLSAELAAAAPVIPEGEMSKELRDALEREIDTREQLRFAEEDLKRTQMRLQDVENENEGLVKKLSKSAKLRPPMVRSASEGNAHLQLELAEHQVEHLSTKVERLEKTNDHLTKKILELETVSTKRTAAETAVRSGGGEFIKMTPEMEKDMSKMISTISELERKNLELNHQLKSFELKNSSVTNNTLATYSSDLRAEQEKRRTAEAEIIEMKQILLKTENQKLISLATKVEQLNNQLILVNERCNNLHKKAVKDADSAKYLDDMKTKLENVEKQLSEKKAIAAINELQGKGPAIDDMEQCCEVLASIEMQTSRICKQMEKIDNAQKDERRRSLSKDSGAAIIAEVAHLMEELKKIHGLMDAIKASGPSLIRRSPMRELNTSPRVVECYKCKENEKFIEEQQNEIVFYKKKNKDLTNQVLQTEDRWTIEIEKQRQIFENEIKNLGVRLSDSKRQVEELSQMLDSKASTLVEKTRALEEQEDKNKKIQKELDEQKKGLQELETDKKSVREFEIKYKKLESIFDQEREKMNSERSRTKNEIVALKKIAEDAEELLKQTSDELRKKEISWKSDKSALDREITSLKKQLLAFKNGEGCENDERASSHDSEKADSMKLSRHDSEKIHLIDLKKQIALLEKKNADYEAKMEEIKIANVDLKDEVKKTKEGWQKEKDAYQHKSRQTEKIRTVEMDALQQKFSSRMRIMEDTNKSLHSQLVLARRERDTHKEALSNYEKRMLEEKKGMDAKDKEHSEAAARSKSIQKRCADIEAELERVATDLRLTKEARKADQILWKMDRARGRNEKLSDEDIKSAESVQQQYAEQEKFYAKEVDRLNERIKQLSAEALNKQTENMKIVRELRETIRVLEIEQRNLSQKKDGHIAAKELLESQTERLQQVVHMTELQKLTRKYRLSSIIDQLQYVTDPMRRNGRIELDHPDGMRYIITQLIAIRDEDGQSFNVDERERCPSAQPSLDRNGYAPSVSDCGDGTYDNISQSSFSIRSVTSMPIRSTVRWTNNQASVVSSTISPPPQSAPITTTASTSAINKSQPSLPKPLNTPTKRSFSSESNTGFDRYGRVQPRKSAYPDPPPSFILNLLDTDKDKTIEYDKDGRIHYVPKGLGRTASFDRRSEGIEEDEQLPHSRNGSTGTNILYRIRREELARGGQPSVKLMAKAFEAIDEPKTDKRGFFGIRKSRSVETTQDRNGKKEQPSSSSNTLKHSLSQVDEGVTSIYGTLPRGGRNPFKNMGSKLVERVRRSLSRSSRPRDDSIERKDEEPKKEKEKGSLSPKKAKRKSNEAKARKISAESNGT